ncbi:hypothetical protein D3C71_1361960 [compost metagenome]
MSQLADGRRLADAVHADEQNYRDSVRILLQRVVVVAPKKLHQLAGENRLQLGCILNPLLLHLCAQILDQCHDCIHAYVSPDQNLFKLLVEFLVDFFSPDNQVRDLLYKALAGLLQTLTELLRNALGLAGNALLQLAKKTHIFPPVSKWR